jgi:hypothetical protein
VSALLGLPVEYPHRLALGVEVVDTVTGARVEGPLVVRREPVTGDGRGERPGVRPFLGDTGGRFKLLYHRSVGGVVALRTLDRQRRYVPRRFAVGVRPEADVTAAEAEPPGAYVMVASRTLRPWLFPGSAYPVAGATGIRGRVLRGGRPARWARITAVHSGAILGRAHGDEHGEFLLLLLSGAEFPTPVPRTIDVELVVRTGPPATDLPAGDPLADLPVEAFPVPVHPPDPADPRLRGFVPPPGYLTAAHPWVETVPVGTVVTPPPFSADP